MMALMITSPAFAHQSEIPRQYTCDGADLSPPLQWSGIPEGSKSLVLIVDDPDAPDPQAPKITWVHWLLYNLPVTVPGLSEGVSSSQLPPGTRAGTNSWHLTGYGGPCPPIGKHRYFHKLYALNTMLPDLGNPTKTQLEQAMAGKILSKTELVGTYQRR